MREIRVYCDGSGNTFDSDGGWGYRIIDEGEVVGQGSGYLQSATNNVAEITAAIEGIESVKTYIAANHQQPVQVTLVSDSQLTLGYASGRYKCKALHLTPLYIKIRALHDELGLKTEWVKGHNGDEHNEACDKLAKHARESKGTVEPSSKTE